MDQQQQSAKNPVVWFEIYVNDMDRAKKFYGTVLNMQLDDMSDPTDGNVQMSSFPMEMEAQNAAGALVKMEGMPGGGSGTVVYFQCKDCATEEARVTKAGGQVIKSKMPIGEYGFMVLAKDTEGNVFGLHSMQ